MLAVRSIRECIGREVITADALRQLEAPHLFAVAKIVRRVAMERMGDPKAALGLVLPILIREPSLSLRLSKSREHFSLEVDKLVKSRTKILDLEAKTILESVQFPLMSALPRDFTLDRDACFFSIRSILASGTPITEVVQRFMAEVTKTPTQFAKYTSDAPFRPTRRGEIRR